MSAYDGYTITGMDSLGTLISFESYGSNEEEALKNSGTWQGTRLTEIMVRRNPGTDNHWLRVKYWRPIYEKVWQNLPKPKVIGQGLIKESALAYCLEISNEELDGWYPTVPPERHHHALRLLASEHGTVLAKLKLRQANVDHYFDWGKLLGG